MGLRQTVLSGLGLALGLLTGCLDTTQLVIAPPAGSKSVVWMLASWNEAGAHVNSRYAAPAQGSATIVALQESKDPAVHLLAAFFTETLEELHLDVGDIPEGSCPGQSVQLVPRLGMAGGPSLFGKVGELLLPLPAEDQAKIQVQAQAFLAARNDRPSSFCNIDATCPVTRIDPPPWTFTSTSLEGGEVVMIAGLNDPRVAAPRTRIIFEQVPAYPSCDEACQRRLPILQVATREEDRTTRTEALPTPRPAGVAYFSAGTYLEPGRALLAGTDGNSVRIYIYQDADQSFLGPLATSSTAIADGPIQAMATVGTGPDLDLWATTARGAILHRRGSNLERVLAPIRIVNEPDGAFSSSLVIAGDGSVLVAGVGDPRLPRQVNNSADLFMVRKGIIRIRGGQLEVEAIERYQGREYAMADVVTVWGQGSELASVQTFASEFDQATASVLYRPGATSGAPWVPFTPVLRPELRLGEYNALAPTRDGFVAIGATLVGGSAGVSFEFSSARAAVDPALAMVECGATPPAAKLVILGPSEWVETVSFATLDSTRRALGPRVLWWMARR
ncbi:MAG: hypothetical protein U1E65_30890 [Myxococcota bacterium]